MRRDALGFFWNDTPPEKKGPGVKAERGPRPIPAIPETGWRAPTEFPRLDGARIIGLDTETKDLELKTKGPGCRRGAHLIGLSVATEDRSWYFPMRHEMGNNLDPVNVLRWARDELTRPGQPKVGTNLLYDLDFLATEGVKVAGPFHDIQVAEALLDENADGFSLDAIANRHVGRGKEDTVLKDWIRAAYGSEQDYRADLYRAPAELVGFYGEFDASLPPQIMQQQLAKLDGDGLLDLNTMEQELIPMLLAMRQRGVRVDVPYAEQLESELDLEVKGMYAQLKALTGVEVNINAADSIAKAFDAAGISYPKTKTGKPSFVKEWLLAHPSPIAQQISHIRSSEKFLDTFLRGYILGLNVDGRLHCLFNQSKTDDYGTVSGRFSSAKPNLQNIPARDEKWGPRIRACFLPEVGEEWVKFDWSQIEFRFGTHYGKGPSAEAARELYRTDPKANFHKMVANLVWPDRAAKMYKPAKNINFGLVYGMGVDLLAHNAGMTVEEAAPIIAEYHSRMPFIKSLYDDTSALAAQRGYILTFMKRRRRFHLWEPIRYERKQDDRKWRPVALPLKAAIAEYGAGNIRRAFTHKALNGLFQGSAADLMKKASRDYWHCPLVGTFGAPLLTVHDEFDFSSPRGAEGDRAKREMKELMETTIKLRIPVIAELEVGPNWGETK